MATDPLLRFLAGEQPAFLAQLIHWVSCPSSSRDKAAVDRFGDVVARACAEVGGVVVRHPQTQVGDHLEVHWGEGGARPLLIVAHLDTVYDDGGLADNPVRQEGDCLFGPGILDMKAGALAILWAIKALQATGLEGRRPLVALFTSDEELGSPTSRSLIEGWADHAAACLVVEPAAGPGGALKTWRKGTGQYRVRIHGRAAHAGVAPEAGIHAIEELAHQIMVIHALATPQAGTSVSVGLCRGGSRVNVIPDLAEAEVDVRFARPAEGERVDAALRSLRPTVPGAQVVVSGGIERPPMTREQAWGLFQLAGSIAEELGFALAEAGTGGGSDGNFTAARGCPTLDGLGAVGDGAHSPGEHVRVDLLPVRTALLAHLLLRVPGDWLTGKG